MDIIIPILDFMSQYPSLIWVNAIIVFVLSIVGLIKFVLTPCYTHIWIPIYNFFKFCHLTIVRVEWLTEQMRPNGGSSFRDLVESIRKELDNINFAIRKIEGKQNITLTFLGDVSEGLGFFETDKNGLCTHITPHYSQIFGLLEGESIGLGWINAIIEDERDKVFKEWSTAVQQKRTFFMQYTVMNKQEKKPIAVVCVAMPLFVGSEVVGYIGAIREGIKNEAV